MRRALVLAFIALGSTFPASAAPRYTAGYAPCLERAGGVTAAMIECMATEFGVQDRRLNTLYRQALTALPAPRRSALTKAQRAWLAFKTAECAFVLDPDGGTAARIAANDCALRMTTERADQLAAVLASVRGR